MLPRRYSQRTPISTSINSSINLYANENEIFCPPKQYLQNSFVPHCINKMQSKRQGLSQVDKNITENKCNAFQSADNIKNYLYPIKDPKDQNSKEHNNLFLRISDLLKHEEKVQLINVSTKSNRYLKVRERPYTSLSSRNRLSQDLTSFDKCQVVLDLSSKQPQEIPEQKKVSKSRALMQYSKVYRNVPGDRFKVKKSKPLATHFAMVSAQKISLKQKNIKQKKQVQKVQKTQSKPRFQRRKSLPIKQKSRYGEEEEFEIGAWDYYE